MNGSVKNARLTTSFKLYSIHESTLEDSFYYKTSSSSSSSSPPAEESFKMSNRMNATCSPLSVVNKG